MTPQEKENNVPEENSLKRGRHFLGNTELQFTNIETRSDGNKWQYEIENTKRNFHLWTQFAESGESISKFHRQKDIGTSDQSFINRSLDPNSDMFQQLTKSIGIDNDEDAVLLRKFLLQQKE